MTRQAEITETLSHIARTAHELRPGAQEQILRRLHAVDLYGIFEHLKTRPPALRRKMLEAMKALVELEVAMDELDKKRRGGETWNEPSSFS